jgi:hypothetical protein
LKITLTKQTLETLNLTPHPTEANADGGLDLPVENVLALAAITQACAITKLATLAQKAWDLAMEMKAKDEAQGR